MTSPPALLPIKQHYKILDGLRGVAALTVVLFHTFEANNNGNRFVQIINHGYLAVDFFFLLSGFVVAYAYDDRWPRMTQWAFYKRRLIRLQPMVVLGSIIGALCFYFGAGHFFPMIATVPVWKLLLVMLVGCTLLPLTPSLDIRGWQEMHPLNGPAWSLFFEYLANIAYALGIRKLPKPLLAILVFLCACLTFSYLVFGRQGDMIGGWSIDRVQFPIGLIRVLFPFFAGMLLMRSGWRIRIPQAFPICAILLVAALALPRFGGPQHLWVNGLYEAFCILLLFPLVVLLGAGAGTDSPRTHAVSTLLGDLSYPLYITHYALIYIYTAWIADHITAGAAIPTSTRTLVGLGLYVTAILIAYASLKLYDEPVRAWLTRRFLPRETSR